jgi:hypothetical protein
MSNTYRTNRTEVLLKEEFEDTKGGNQNPYIE